MPNKSAFHTQYTIVIAFIFIMIESSRIVKCSFISLFNLFSFGSQFFVEKVVHLKSGEIVANILQRLFLQVH